MDTIADLIAEEKYTNIMLLCEQLEIQHATDTTIDISQVYPIYLASCIIINDFESARYVRKRIQDKTAEIDAIWKVVVDLIKKSYPQVYQDLDAFEWSQSMQPFIAKIKETVRQHMLELTSKIYTSIELSQAVKLFGIPEAELLRELSARGWEYVESTQILRPAKQAPIKRKTTDSHQFAKLADIVVNLEKF